jgi:hypothetical protein
VLLLSDLTAASTFRTAVTPVSLDVLGPVPGVGVMAKRSQGWVKCEDRLPYYPEITEEEEEK